MPLTPSPSEPKDPRKSSSFAPVAPAPLGAIEAPWEAEKRLASDERERRLQEERAKEWQLRAQAARKVLDVRVGEGDAAARFQETLPREFREELLFTGHRARILDHVMGAAWRPHEEAPHPMALLEPAEDGKWAIRTNGAWTRGAPAAFDSVEAAFGALCSPRDVQYLTGKLRSLRKRATDPVTGKSRPGVGYKGLCVTRADPSAAPANALKEAVDPILRRIKSCVDGLLELGNRFAKKEAFRDWSGGDRDVLGRAKAERDAVVADIADAVKKAVLDNQPDWGGDAVILNFMSTDTGFLISGGQFDASCYSRTFNPYSLRSMETDDFDVREDPLMDGALRPVLQMGKLRDPDYSPSAELFSTLRSDAEFAEAKGRVKTAADAAAWLRAYRAFSPGSAPDDEAAAKLMEGPFEPSTAEILAARPELAAAFDEIAAVNWRYALMLEEGPNAFNAHALLPVAAEGGVAVEQWVPFSFSRIYRDMIEMGLAEAKEAGKRGENYLAKRYDKEDLRNANMLLAELCDGRRDSYVFLFKTILGKSARWWTRVVPGKRNLQIRQGQDHGPFEEALKREGHVFASHPSARKPAVSGAKPSAAPASAAGPMRRSVTGFFPPQKVD